MRRLRDSLIQLFRPSWEERKPHARIQASVIRQACDLLSPAHHPQFGVNSQLISHGRLHRHIVTIHCPDQAFYPDAIRSYLQKHNIQPVQQQSVLFSREEKEGCLCVSAQIKPHNSALFLVLHLPAATTENIAVIEQDFLCILSGVHQSVIDFPSMRSELERIAIYLANDEPLAAKLLQWMIDEHYLFFGLLYPEHDHKNIGICKNKTLLVSMLPDAYDDLNKVDKAEKPGLDWLHFSSTFKHVYSEINVRTVRICWEETNVLHTAVLVGHFSRGARYINASHLPQLTEYWSVMAADTSLIRSAFYQREVRTLFDRAPKSLLHSIPVAQWLKPFKQIIEMNSPTEVVVSKLLPKHGNVDYLLIAVERHRFGNNIWANMKEAIVELNFQVFGVEYYGVGSVQLIFAAVRTKTWPALSQLNESIRKCVIFWKDQARRAVLNEPLPPSLLHDTLQELSQISNLYQDQFEPEQFVRDVLVREQIKQDGKTRVRLFLHHDENRHGVEIHILSSKAMPLAKMTEKLNAFALVTMEQSLTPLHYGSQHMHICRFQCEAPAQLHAEALPRLSRGIQDVFNQDADHDALNALLVLCGLSIRDIAVLIALRNHLTQLVPDVWIEALSDMMIRHPKVSLYLFRMFEGKHRPTMPVAHFTQAQLKFTQAMVDVNSLKDDTWFSSLAELVRASLRSNAWQRESGEALAIKIDPVQLSYVPKPCPYREIYVHGVCMDGVHLRAGPIARGGLRYSDRPTDFRTEVLELMATQVVKNGQIVPTGAKGGFVVRDGQGKDFVLRQYHQFIRALLSITDNRVQGKLLPPKGMKIAPMDVDDTYLVVAADKGTARYSDDANEESLNADFWLGDAFASGGSQGYDHKEFGITARGAWVSAAHHFARLGANLWSDPVTAVGIGDMGGDVFGNGMLLNPNLKLIAAFNHQHIFLDPKPDVAKAFKERQRLFANVSGWDAYDTSLISAGGGIFKRAAKSIHLSAAVKKVLGIEENDCSGEALIRAILKAPVDLLYNGGIGTYVKASFENNAQAQDPANNAVRVDANTLRCKVLSEGGNLGLTQAARIEFAQHEGIINTDAIDNAAGVNMSDHEVNLKILLSHEPFQKRNRLLRSVANFVAAQCLNDNKEQAIALSLAEFTALYHLPRLQHLQNHLIEKQRLSATPGLTSAFALRPVFAEWLGHEKNRVHQRLDDLDFFNRSIFGELFLMDYFPASLRKKYHDEIINHPLARDIAHTRISSYIINRYGLVSINYLQNLTFTNADEVVQVLLIADALLETGVQYDVVFKDGDGDLNAWYLRQQQVLDFANGLLALKSHMKINKQWLAATQRVLGAYAKKQGCEKVDLADLVTALVLSEKENKPLTKCLKATQQCLDTLPFDLLSSTLRTPLWANDDAHALRNEWLGRLIQLKISAAQGLLRYSGKQRTIRLSQWMNHPLHQKLKDLLKTESGLGQEEQRLRCILALTHLQTIVETEAD